jgi:hypothetical protein
MKRTYCRGDIRRTNVADILHTAFSTPRASFLLDQAHIAIKEALWLWRRRRGLEADMASLSEKNTIL